MHFAAQLAQLGLDQCPPAIIAVTDTLHSALCSQKLELGLDVCDPGSDLSIIRPKMPLIFACQPSVAP